MSKIITELAGYEVFIFGSNSEGHSCSGSAGLAIRGPNWRKMDWREDPFVRRAMKAPVGHVDRIGYWGVYGVGRGWSKGHYGMSYAIETVRRAGWKRSTPISEIEDQWVQLCQFAEEHPGWAFLATEIGSGLGGWSNDEMAYTLAAALTRYGSRPGNLVIPPDLYDADWSRWRDNTPKVAS